MMGLYALGFYLPTLIKASGVTTSTTVGFLSAIPYLVAVVAMVTFGRSSDRMRERRWHLAIVLLLGAAGLTASVWTSHSVVLTVITMSIAAAGIISYSPIMWSVPTAFLGGAAAAASIGVINSAINIGGFVSPYLIGWVKDEFNTTDPAIYIIAGCLTFGALMALSFDRKLVNR